MFTVWRDHNKVAWAHSMQQRNTPTLLYQPNLRDLFVNLWQNIDAGGIGQMGIVPNAHLSRHRG